MSDWLLMLTGLDGRFVILKIYGFILQAVELPLPCGSCEDDVRFLWRRSLWAHCIGDALTLLDRVFEFFWSEDCLVILSTWSSVPSFDCLLNNDLFVCRSCDMCSHFSSESPICRVLFPSAGGKDGNRKRYQPSWTTQTQTCRPFFLVDRYMHECKEIMTSHDAGPSVYSFQHDADFSFSIILEIISYWIIRRLVTCFFIEHESAIDGSLTMIRSGECHEGSQDVKNGVATTGWCFTIVTCKSGWFTFLIKPVPSCCI